MNIMKQFVKKIRIILCFILLFIFTFSIKSYAIEDNSDEYIIDKYHVEIEVNKNNIYDITETITTNFLISKHGIIRSIPLKNDVSRLDGSHYTNHAQISEINVNENYTKTKENNYLKLKIGNEDESLTGQKTYKIHYKYNIGNDPLKNIDEFYMNIIGDQWDTKINNISFDIKMPKKFNTNKIGFAYGEHGSTNNSAVKYTVKNNIISGKINKMLNPGEAFTIRVELPNNYFEKQKIKITFFDCIIMLFCLIATISSISIAKKYKMQDTDIIETVEFYPPNNLNSLETEFMFNGFCSKKGITSLLIYLANKGYLSIIDTKDCILKKIKKYDEENKIEAFFLNGLFHNKKEIKISELSNKFYKTSDKILENINTKKNQDKLFDSKVVSKEKLILILICIIYFIINILPLSINETDILNYPIFSIILSFIGYYNFFTILIEQKRKQKLYITNLIRLTFSDVQNNRFWMIIIVSSIVIMFLFVGGPFILLIFLFTCLKYLRQSNSKKNTIIGLIISLLTYILPFNICILPELQLNNYLLIYIVGLISIVIMIFSLQKLNDRTEFGNAIYGKILGFKNFLNIAEKEKLEMLVSNDPNYFYNILPYTYVFNLSDKWIKKFETITIAPPDWSENKNDFNSEYFMHNTLTSMSNSMYSSPSSSSSSSSDSGSSCGSSSGGGSGGGGGSSW